MPSLMWDLDAIARCATQYRAEMLAPLGLKSCHASYLLHICADPGISQEQLAKRIYFNKSSVARQLAALEEDGFIRRVPSPEDRRVTQLYPTEKSRSILPRIKEVLQDWENLVTQSLTPEESDSIQPVLQKMRRIAAQRVQSE